MNFVVLLTDRPESHSALDWALDTAGKLADDPAAVTVHIVMAGGADSPASPNYTSPALAAQARQRLQDAGVKYELHAAEGDLADQVVTLATDTGADLVALGLRRRSAAMKLLLGSHTQRILLDAPCPVVGVKEPA
ncbi:universal stress protein [Rhodococcus sp. T2V]|uniref:universal stress protein n=1 Tax=Rhodococcus sp. T2V TaxID=3034164 RepID=UPI0023E34231|nr:universal stress protein [Rhodococcus sp. T2V]MDF3312032.1 universal stress protein [Rhodococcus sp. T2V]